MLARFCWLMKFPRTPADLWDQETNEKLDKDVFRRDLGSLTDAYEKILANWRTSTCIRLRCM